MSKRENQTRGKPDVVGLRRSRSGQNQTQNQTILSQKTRRGKPGPGKERKLVDQQNQTDRTRQKPDTKTPICGNAVVMRLSAKTRHDVWLSRGAVAETGIRKGLSRSQTCMVIKTRQKTLSIERESFFA